MLALIIERVLSVMLSKATSWYSKPSPERDSLSRLSQTEYKAPSVSPIKRAD